MLDADTFTVHDVDARKVNKFGTPKTFESLRNYFVTLNFH